MGFLPFFKGSKKAEPCEHPSKFILPLHDDASEPEKVTGYKCARCGARVPDPAATTKAA